MTTEIRCMIIPQIIGEIHRQKSLSHDSRDNPDVLLLHPQDLMNLRDEMTDPMKWSSQPSMSEVKYGTFYGLDILVHEKMSAGAFVVGKRIQIERKAIAK